MILLLICICSVLAGLSSGEDCSARNAYELVRCYSLWGYDQYAIYGQRYRGEMFNFTKLLEFCRSPEPVDTGDCVRDALDNCDVGWGEDGWPVWDSQMDLLGEGVRYLCNQQKVIERHLSCLDEASNRITRCARNVIQRYTGPLDEAHAAGSWTDIQTNMRALGQETEQCIVDVVRENCGTDVGNVLGNFLYGAGTYPYAEENRNSR